MANELRISFAGAAATLYCLIRKVSDHTVWNGTAFETWANANIANYDIALTDRSGDLYTADFPTAIDSGDYHIYYYEMAGATPAITDLKLADEVKHWNGAALASSSSVTLSAYALATLAQVKRDLDIDDSDDDTILTEHINHVSAWIETVTARQFLAREYRERFDVDFSDTIALRWPVKKVRRVSYGNGTAFTVTHTASVTQASVTVYNDNATSTSGGLVLQTVNTSGVETTNDLTFASYPSVSLLVAAINLVSGWSATTSADGPSYDLNPNVYEDAESRTLNIGYPDQVLTSYRIDHKTGLMKINGGGGWPSSGWNYGAPGRKHGYGYGFRGEPNYLPGGFQHILVKSRCGYESIPDDVNMLARELVRDKHYERQTDPSITSIALGPYSASFARDRETQGTSYIRAKLAHYIDAGAFVARN